MATLHIATDPLRTPQRTHASGVLGKFIAMSPFMQPKHSGGTNIPTREMMTMMT